MKKKLFSGLMATIMFLALVLTGCSQTVTPGKETTQKPNNTTQKIEAITTTGEMGTLKTAADGSITLTTTDSTGGTYNFTQPATVQASSRAASPTETWNYTNRNGIKQYEGTYNGDITKGGTNNLNLTVEKAVDENGTLQEVTEPQSFNFAVSDTGTFSATIPAVEIVVETTAPIPPATEVKLIKTVTINQSSNSGNHQFCDSEYLMGCEFYSDKTFKIYLKGKFTASDFNFTYAYEGLLYAGTYTGDPLTDGTVVQFNIQKINKDLYSSNLVEEDEEIFTAYKKGEPSKTIIIDETGLTPITPVTEQLTIQGDYAVAKGANAYSTYTPNEDTSTTFKLEVVGDDVELFKLCYRLFKNNGDGSYSSFSQDEYRDLSETISLPDATENTVINLYLFIDKNNDGTMNDGIDNIVSLPMIDIKRGHQTTAKVEIKKLPIQFTINGNTSQYQNIHISTGYNGSTVPMSEGKIDVYVNNQTISISLTAQEHSTSEYHSGYSISDTVEFYLNEEVPPTVTLTLYDKLKEGKKITVQEYPISETSSAEEKKFRFEKGTDGNIIFYIPTGTGSDGEFLSPIAERTRTPLKYCLIDSTYAGLSTLSSSASKNMNYQFTGLVDNMKDIVYFLENRMKLTVAGKDLIGL